MKYAAPHITSGDIVWVQRAMSTGWLTQGPLVTKFEQMVAAYVGAKYAVAFNSATSALFSAYTSVFPPGERVTMPAITFVATANAAVNAQLDPVFTGDTVVGENCAVVHLAGRWCDFVGRRVVEDAAHAFGSSGPDGKIGNCKRSDVCVFSTHAIKNITTGEGGIATTNSKRHRDNMLMMRNHGRNGKKCIFPGWNFRMTEMQAALGISQIERVDRYSARRAEIFDQYREGLMGLVELPEIAEYPTFWHLFIIKTAKRDRLQRFLAKNGVETAVNYPTVYSQPAYRKAERYLVADAEDHAKRCLSLPMHNNLKDEDVRRVIELVKEWK